MKNITHFNLIELTDKNHNSFKSFVFDISFLDRDIIYDKNLWPRGIQIGKFKKKYIQPVNQASALTSNSAPISKKNDETFNVHATGMEHTESNIVV